MRNKCWFTHLQGRCATHALAGLRLRARKVGVRCGRAPLVSILLHDGRDFALCLHQLLHIPEAHFEQAALQARQMVFLRAHTRAFERSVVGIMQAVPEAALVSFLYKLGAHLHVV